MSQNHVILTDGATPLQRRLLTAIQSGALDNAMGRGATNKVKAHLFKRNETHPNQLGGKRTNFYTASARATSYTSRPGRIEIDVNHLGIRQRVEGGVIRAGSGGSGKKYLTIPNVPEAHGRRASEFSNLRFGFGENKYGNLQPALVKRSASLIRIGRKKKDGTRSVKHTGSVGGEVIYWLTPRVYQRPDPSVMPNETELLGAAMAAGDDYLKSKGVVS